jgi:hypothetical protein
MPAFIGSSAVSLSTPSENKNNFLFGMYENICNCITEDRSGVVRIPVSYSRDLLLKYRPQTGCHDEVFRAFPVSQGEYWDSAFIYSETASCHIISNSLFINLTIIHLYIIANVFISPFK